MPEFQPIGGLEPPMDEASRRIAADLEAGPMLVGSKKITVHRKAILAIMASNRALTERNTVLQEGLDQAAMENERLGGFLSAALDLLREAKGWDHDQTGKAVSDLVSGRMVAQQAAEAQIKASFFPTSPD